MTLRDYRLKLQITTGDMAKKIGIKPSELCAIERGKKASEELLIKIKESYQIPEEDFRKVLEETASHFEDNKADEEKFIKILQAVPKDLKKDETRVLKCPICGNATFTVSRSGYNGHLHVSCKCGVMIMQ
jgi:transcriptional regulator with XRE-family HTH domain